MDYQTQSQLFYMQEQLRNLSEGYQKMLLTEKQKQEQVAMVNSSTKCNFIKENDRSNKTMSFSRSII